jgi:hypothetical protein
MAVTKIKSAVSKAKGVSATLSNVPAGKNLPVNYSFQYRKLYSNDLNVPKDAQLSVCWRRYYELAVLGDRKLAREMNLYFE